jgi:hypothetical protein
MMILDIGCGKNKQERGAIGLDRQRGSIADVLCELGHYPWPVKSSCADKIYLSHFLEHQIDILGAMREVHRIGRPGCEVVVVTPHYTSMDSYTDPTHYFHLALHSFDYFARDAFENFTYGAGGFQIVERHLTFGGNFFLDNLARLWATLCPDFYEKHLAWIFPARNIFCRLRVMK